MVRLLRGGVLDLGLRPSVVTWSPLVFHEASIRRGVRLSSIFCLRAASAAFSRYGCVSFRSRRSNFRCCLWTSLLMALTWRGGGSCGCSRHHARHRSRSASSASFCRSSALAYRCMRTSCSLKGWICFSASSSCASCSSNRRSQGASAITASTNASKSTNRLHSCGSACIVVLAQSAITASTNASKSCTSDGLSAAGWLPLL